MRKRIAILSAAAAIGLSVFSFGSITTQTASAAPITCPAGQTVEKNPNGGGFYCETGGGTVSGADRTKNPNDKR